MSQVNKLYRNFIILQEDERGYSNSNDKTLSGYSKIEAKGNICKISFYAQNLRKDDEDYCILAICNKKDTKKIINLGAINISDGGKAEITKEYPLDNVGGLGISYDKISGAAIGKMKNNIPIIVMCGFINGEQPSESWKNYKVEKSVHSKSKDKMEYMKKEDKKKKHRSEEDINKVEVIEEEIEEREINLKEDAVNEEIENTEVDEDGIAREKLVIDESETRDNKDDDMDKDIEDENNPFKNKEYGKNPFDTNINDNLYGIEDLNRGYLKNKFDEYEEKLENTSEFQIRGSVGEYFESLANGFEQCRSKYEEIKYCKWYKIPVNDLHEMCNMSNYNRYAVAYYPMLNYYPYIRKYRHFMLGYKCDKDGNLRYIVYGIPGMKNKDEQPYEGKTGFVTWVSDEARDGMGCWLMFYDFKNSTVVVPMQ
ncbi:hypothetical protein [Clostridium nigeriense]|uniref:DUF7922 domain-containing protein n=1 Tax=Clostridium nigeriense TaxID=1805470 RepID=UPI000832FD40|nr:hypothetical protein [Clostridium nigeriense]